MYAADGLIELPEETTGIMRGESVAFIPFSELGLVGWAQDPLISCNSVSLGSAWRKVLPATRAAS